MSKTLPKSGSAKSARKKAAASQPRGRALPRGNSSIPNDLNQNRLVVLSVSLTAAELTKFDRLVANGLFGATRNAVASRIFSEVLRAKAPITSRQPPAS